MSDAIENVDAVKPWAEKWIEMIRTMDSLPADEALLYFMSVMMPTVSSYTESQMGEQADIMNTVSQLTNDLNDIQADFNTMKNGDPNQQQLTPDQDAAMKDAINKANDVLDIVENDPAFASITDTVLTQMHNLFCYDDGGNDIWNDDGTKINQTDYSRYKVGQTWINAWNTSWNPDNPDQSYDSTTPYTDAITAMSTTFNGQSSTAQAIAQYEQSNDQQYLGIMQDLADQWIQEEESAIQGSKYQ